MPRTRIAVLDAVGSERVAVFGSFMGGPVATYLAAQFPERVTALALYNATAAYGRGEDAARDRTEASAAANVTDLWGRSNFGLSEAISDRHAEWWQRYQRMSMGPGDAKASMAVIARDDVRQLLARIRVPALVVANTRSPIISTAHGRYLAEHIDGARLGFGALLAELFPTEVRSTAMGTTYNLARTVQLGAPVLVGYAVAWRGLSGGLSVPLVLALLTASWVWVLPETRGIVLPSLNGGGGTSFGEAPEGSAVAPARTRSETAG